MDMKTTTQQAAKSQNRKLSVCAIDAYDECKKQTEFAQAVSQLLATSETNGAEKVVRDASWLLSDLLMKIDVQCELLYQEAGQ